MRHMKRRLFIAAAAVGLCRAACASPLVELYILGSDNGVNWTPIMQVLPGQSTYDFEVVGQLAPIGTVNTHGTITSEVEGVDGLGSLSFNLLAAGGNPIQISFTSEQLQGTFANGTGASAGTVTSSGGGNNNEVAGSRPINPNGTFNAINGSPLVIESGTFTVDTSPAGQVSTLVTGTFGGIFSSGKINDGTGVTMTSVSESSSDPVQSIQPLTIYGVDFLVPEPASLTLFGLAVAGLLARRKRDSV